MEYWVDRLTFEYNLTNSESSLVNVFRNIATNHPHLLVLHTPTQIETIPEDQVIIDVTHTISYTHISGIQRLLRKTILEYSLQNKKFLKNEFSIPVAAENIAVGRIGCSGGDEQQVGQPVQIPKRGRAERSTPFLQAPGRAFGAATDRTRQMQGGRSGRARRQNEGRQRR